MVRLQDSRQTIYEIRLPKSGLGADAFVDGMRMGFGICLNDGDSWDRGIVDTQGGHKGWSGWGPYSIVYGKNSAATGLITLTGQPSGGRGR
eukprot:SAG22_NODE_8244_length_671_cov_1.094406_2_plen_91_part_00